MSEHDAARLRRLRAALGASADSLLSQPVDRTELLLAEARFLVELTRRLGREELTTTLWRDLRNHALALAADLPPDRASLELLERQLVADATPRRRETSLPNNPESG